VQFTTARWLNPSGMFPTSRLARASYSSLKSAHDQTVLGEFPANRLDGAHHALVQRLSSISVGMAIAGYLCRWIFWGCLTHRAPSRSSPKDVESDQGAPQDEQQSSQDHDRARLRPDEAGDERGVEAQGDRRPFAQNPRAPDGYTKEDESRSVREEGQDEYYP
jgi:hypothetical protein